MRLDERGGRSAKAVRASPRRVVIGLWSIRGNRSDDHLRDLDGPGVLLKKITKAADMNARPGRRERRDNQDGGVLIVYVADAGVVVGVGGLIVVVVMRVEMPMSDFGVM